MLPHTRTWSVCKTRAFQLDVCESGRDNDIWQEGRPHGPPTFQHTPLLLNLASLRTTFEVHTAAAKYIRTQEQVSRRKFRCAERDGSLKEICKQKCTQLHNHGHRLSTRREMGAC